MAKKEQQYLDLEGVLKKRLKGKYKFIPKFFINYLKKKIHQEELNGIIKNHETVEGLEFAKAALDEYNLTIEVDGIENIDKSKRYVLAANHPLGGLDGISLLYKMGTEIGETKAIVNDILLNLEKFRPLFEGVNVYGNFSKEQIRILDELYKSDKQIIVFPAGLVSRKIKGKITDLEWKKSFLKKSIQYKRDVVPVFVEGGNSNVFYRFANFRKFIGIKFNIELVLLPDEMFKLKNKTIIIKIGKPIPYQTFDKSKSIKEWVKFVREKTYEMQD